MITNAIVHTIPIHSLSDNNVARGSMIRSLDSKKSRSLSQMHNINTRSHLINTWRGGKIICHTLQYRSWIIVRNAILALSTLIIPVGCHAAQNATPEQTQSTETANKTTTVHQNQIHVFIGDGLQPTAGSTKLAQLAFDEVANPPVSLPPIPPDIATDKLQPRSLDDPRAFMSLIDAAQIVTTETGSMIEPYSIKPVTDEDETEAVLLYLDARSMYLDGLYFDAFKRAEQALLFDPNSSDILRLLARCSHETTGLATALQYYNRILSIDPHDREALLTIAAAYLGQGKPEETIAILSIIVLETNTPIDNTVNAIDNTRPPWSGIEEPVEPLLDHLAFNLVAHAYAQLGFDLAAIQSWTQAIDLPHMTPNQSRFSNRISSLYRDRGRVQLAIGDAFARLQRFDDALNAYDLATQYAMVNRKAVLIRRTYALNCLGRPMQAMYEVLHIVVQSQSNNSDASNIQNTVPTFASLDLSNEFYEYLATFPESQYLAESLATIADENNGSLALTKAAAALATQDQAKYILTTYLNNHAADTTAWIEFLRWARDAQSPEFALELFMTHPDPTAINLDEVIKDYCAILGQPHDLADAWDSLDNSIKNNPSAKLLLVKLLLYTNQYNDANDMLYQIDPALPDNTYSGNSITKVLYAQSLIGDGRFIEAWKVLLRLEVTPETNTPLQYTCDWVYPAARLWVSLGQIDHAISLLDILAHNNSAMNPGESQQPADPFFQPTHHYHQHAKLLIKTGRLIEAERVLRNAINVNPKDHESYQYLMNLYSQGGRLADPEKVRNIAQRMTQYVPQSKALLIITAQRDAATGRSDRAISALKALLHDNPSDDATLQALYGAWVANGKINEGISWIEHQMDHRPGDRGLLTILIQLLVADGQYDNAIQKLNSVLDNNANDDDLAQAREDLMIRLGQIDEALQLRQTRLMEKPVTPVRSIRFAHLAIDQHQLDIALTHLKDASKTAKDDLPFILDNIVTALRSLVDTATSLETQSNPDIDLDQISNAKIEAKQYIAEVVNTAVQIFTNGNGTIHNNTISATHPIAIPLTKISEVAHLSRLESLVDLNQDVDVLAVAINDAITDYPESTSEFYYALALFLDRNDRLDDACYFVDKALGSGHETLIDPSYENIAIWRLAQSITRIEVDVAIELTHRLTRSGMFPTAQGAGAPIGITIADALYEVAGQFYQVEGQIEYLKILNAALDVDPNHAGAANDLGYALAEKGVDLQRAERLLLKAYKSDTDNEAFIDSLGWLRYKQMKLHTVVDGIIISPTPQTPHENLGAVDLLYFATTTIGGQSDPVILDHYGDACWRAGLHDKAIDAWSSVTNAYREQIRQAEAVSLELAQVRQDIYQPVLKSAQTKVRAADANRKPHTAPIYNTKDQ